MRVISTNSIELILLSVLFASIGYFAYLAYGLMPAEVTNEPFSGAQALQVATDLSQFGPRPAGSAQSVQAADAIEKLLRQSDWQVTAQHFTPDKIPGRNIIAIRSPAATSTGVVLLVTHYDSRLRSEADPDPAQQLQPSLAANRSLSGAAVLLELARTVDVESSGQTICLLFLDAEENEGVPSWEGGMGSRFYLQRVQQDAPRCATPRFAVIVEMVGKIDLQLRPLNNSDAKITKAIWQVAHKLGYAQQFNLQPFELPVELSTTTIETFQNENIVTILLTDSSYSLVHTQADKIDVLNSGSLEQVGRTLEVWLEQGADIQE